MIKQVKKYIEGGTWAIFKDQTFSLKKKEKKSGLDNTNGKWKWIVMINYYIRPEIVHIIFLGNCVV